MISFTVNNQPFTFKGDPETPLMWVIRDSVKLTGTKYGCGVGECGACSVHLDGAVVRSCVTPIAAVAGKAVVTIEGLAEGEQLTAVQRAWVEVDAPQCGYCQAGQIMAATELLERNPHPTDGEIKEGMNNLCRCGSYHRIRKAVHLASKLIEESK